MKIQVKDGSGYKTAVVDAARYAELGHFIRANPYILRGMGGGAYWGRGSANDATEAESFAIGQLTYLEAKAHAKWYAPMHYEQILGDCIDYSAGPYTKAVDYLVVDGTGMGRLMSPGANDVPMVDVAYAKVTIPVAPGGIGYDYTQEDLRTSAFLKQPLPNTKQVQSILAYKRHMNRIALTGEAPANFKGLYNNSSVTAAARASGAVWDSATGDTIIADVADAYGKYSTASGGNSVPTKMIVPLSTRQVLRKRVGSNSDTTIEKFISETFKLEITDDLALDTVALGGLGLGSGGTKRVVFCDPTNDNIVFHIPMPLQFLAPQLNGYRVVVPGEYKVAGLEIRRIQTVRYMDTV